MPWYDIAKYDRKRLRRVMKEITKRRPELSTIWAKLCRKTGDDTDRLAVADILEEEGERVLSMCVRDYTSCKPRSTKRIKHLKKV